GSKQGKKAPVAAAGAGEGHELFEQMAQVSSDISTSRIITDFTTRSAWVNISRTPKRSPGNSAAVTGAAMTGSALCSVAVGSVVDWASTRPALAALTAIRHSRANQRNLACQPRRGD